MGKRRTISDTYLNSLIKSLNVKNYKDENSIKWVKEFNKLASSKRKEIIKILESEQTLSIIKGIHNLDDIIEVPYLGKFSIKQSRKEYINLCKEFPDKPIEEIVKIVKDRHRSKINKSKYDFSK